MDNITNNPAEHKAIERSAPEGSETSISEERKKQAITELIHKGVLVDEQLFERIISVSDEETLSKIILSLLPSSANSIISQPELNFPGQQVQSSILDSIHPRGNQLGQNPISGVSSGSSSELLATALHPGDRFLNSGGVLDEKQFLTGTEPGNVNVIFTYVDFFKKREVQDFVAFFNSRYKSLKSMLANRQELQELTSINRLNGKEAREKVAVIGMIMDKTETVNKNIMLTIEDQSGSIKVIVNKTRKDSFQAAKDAAFDEVIGIVGTCGKGIMFADAIVTPDIPVYSGLKKCPDEVYVAFLSDMHVGSKKFLPEEFGKFLKWVRGESGSEAQRNIASKVKYIVIAGDIIDGIGIYPGQEAELEIKDIYAQYEECARLIRMIPERIKIIICPWNHDSMRISEPQPKLSEKFAKPFWEMNNVTLISNPGIISLHAGNGFPGFDVLVYHGYSFDYYIANIDSIRENGGYDRADLVMKFLLKRRHLAPAHASTLYVPDSHKDSLVIEKVPDFFISGHLHKAAAANYRSVTMICGSCWQSRTAFQEKVGHHPEPCRVPVVNLKTRDIKMLRFDKQEES